jgi:hypothetical protein
MKPSLTQMRAIVIVASILLLLGILGTGCGTGAALVSFSDLTSNPKQYSGKTVTVEGIYVRGWEWILLTDSVAFIGTGDARELRPVGESIWFAGLIPQDIQDNLYQYTSPAGDNSYFGKIKATGLFETEGKYGQMNRYKYRLTASKVELLEWTPPE